MSTKRILGLTIFGVLLIAAAISVMLLTSFLRQDSGAVRLPDTPMPAERPERPEPDALDRVVVNPDTIQAVVSSLDRPATFMREIEIESFWEGGQATFEVSVSVSGGMTSLSILTPAGAERRVIVTPEREYVWYRGDRTAFVRNVGAGGDGRRIADEYQMLLTYEDILTFDRNDIIDAGYIEYAGEVCVFAVYRSPHLGNMRTYYISLELGLVIAVIEYDANGNQIYRMTAGECFIGEIDPAAFILPDGTVLLEG